MKLSHLSFVAFSALALAASSDLWKALNPRSGTLLKPLLQARVPGTPGSHRAREHITSHLARHGWNVDEQRFLANTPVGAVEMTNIMARRPGTVAQGRKLTLAAHYDSKMEPAGFIGAIDSALPCALMLWLAQAEHIDFELVFFDGEEAFHEWSDHDSIYGARALSEDDRFNPGTLVLLDLLGHNGPPVPSWFLNTETLHSEIAAINHWLLKNGSVRRKVAGGSPAHNMVMMDDHIPFLEKGVPVLHLIPSQFPPQWHTLDDNASLLDWDTIETWALVLGQWLHRGGPGTQVPGDTTTDADLKQEL